MIDRMERINQLLRKELSLLLQQDAESLGIIDVVDIETTRDLAQAKVFITSLSEREPVTLLKELQNRAHEYTRLLGKRLQLKRVPHFEFIMDNATDEINRVEELLDEIHNQSGVSK